MRILYGVQGTGNGHLTRARSMARALRQQNIQVDYFFSGREHHDFFDMDAFGEFRCVRGFTLVVRNGRMDLWATIRRNNVFAFLREVTQLRLKEYDLVITDFEPVSAWAARLQNKTCIGLSHQNAFHYNVPKVKGFWSSRLLMKIFAPVDVALGFHWHHFNQPVLPPLIEPHRVKSVVPEKILVYMGFEALDQVIAFLQPFSEFQFQVFAKVSDRQDRGHIQINPVSHDEFHRHLEDCSGVISNAGFEMASECLSLGKKLFVKPLANQYEQLSNALALQVLERATIAKELDQDLLEKWLRSPAHKPVQYPDVAMELAKWLTRSPREAVADLATRLWRETDYADSCHLNSVSEIQSGRVY